MLGMLPNLALTTKLGARAQPLVPCLYSCHRHHLNDFLCSATGFFGALLSVTAGSLGLRVRIKPMPLIMLALAGLLGLGPQTAL
jgi:hypothetical protein